ncbi:MAG: CBS domain-containing protein [Acidobacteria bacterium]|nr:CBS domain-containing protein [Acidobacteriota bacterium]
MDVIRIAQVPPPRVSVTATVKEAIPLIRGEHGCAVAVMDERRLVGTLSKEEVFLRVIATGRDPETVRVGEVMTSPAKTVTTDTGADEALKLMLSLHQCYLPVVNKDGRIRGWLSICDLFENNIEDLAHEIASLEAYIATDGPGG